MQFLNTEEKPRRAAVINDLSGAGKCSLTVMLPVLSALGCETSVLPTAVLSTHGGFKDPVYRDLTDDMLKTAQHWKREGAEFEGICSGYLSSREQIDTVREIFELFTDEHSRPLRLVDPVMGDNGTLYGIFNKETAQSMTRLCEKADILTPNMTEAYCLLHEPFKDGPYDEKELKRVMKTLSDFGPKVVILTGAYTDGKKIGAACYDREKDETALVLSDRVPGKYHGTGDIFAAVMLGAMLNGKGGLCRRRAVHRKVHRRNEKSVRRQHHLGREIREMSAVFDARCAHGERRIKSFVKFSSENLRVLRAAL